MLRLLIRVAAVMGFAASQALAQTGYMPGDCGSLDNPVGPFDYRQHARARTPILENVEGNHFNANVENLVSGQTSYIAGDLDYVLRAFPNHTRALSSLARLSARHRSEKLQGLHYPVSCYFMRAIEFRRDDAMVRAIFAVHLSRQRKPQEALAQMEQALKLGADDSNTLYNAGLLYFEAKNYDKSLEYAKRAYAAGFPLPGLKKKLQSVGKWHD